MNAETRRDGDGAGRAGRPPVWPGDPEDIAAADIDFTALAHVLANTCRFGGRTTQYHSLAAHACVLSEEIEALDGLDAEDRRRLALHALLAGAVSAWLGGAWLRGEHAGSQRAAERTNRLAAGIERSVREAAGLEPVLDDAHAELLRFIARMTSAAEHRDLFGPDAPASVGAAFPPLKRRIRPVDPGRAAKLWLARFRALSQPPRGEGAAGAGDAGGGANATNDGGTDDVAHIPAKEGMAAPRAGKRNERRAA